MRTIVRSALAFAAAWLCLAAVPDRADAQNVPDFIEVGKRYMFGVAGEMDIAQGAEVLAIGTGPWVQVRFPEFDQVVWLNLDMVAIVVEITPEFETFMEENRRSNLDRVYQATMKSDLRNFVMAEEVYFADNLTYVGRDGLSGDYFSTSTGVTVETLHVSDTGWSAVARHASSDTVCYIFVGSAEPPMEGMEEGTPVCR